MSLRAASLVLVVATSAAAQQVTLRRPAEPGQRSSCAVKAELSLELRFVADGNQFQTERRSAQADALVHERVLAVGQDGRPRRVVRTFERLDVRYSSSTQSTMGGEPRVDEGAVLGDARVHNVIELELLPNGQRRVLRAAQGIDDASVLRQLQEDVETDLLPPGPVAVGATWSVPPERIGRPLPAEAGAAPVQHALRVTLAQVARDPQSGRDVATLQLQGSGTYEAALRDDQGQVLQKFITRVEYTGTARLDVATGLPLSQEVQGRFTRREEFTWVAEGPGEWREQATFAHGRHVDDAPPTPGGDQAAPAWPPAGARAGKVPPGHLVLERDDGRSGARLVLLDPAARALGPTLLCVPSEASIDHATLSPSRDRVLFSSRGNNAISIAAWNLFVLDTTTGQVDQLSPSWASGRGLARPRQAEATGSIVGRLEWLDARDRRRRSDGITGTVRVDQTTCGAATLGDGRFRVDGVPAGPALVVVRATLPVESLRQGELHLPRQAVTVVQVPPGGVADAGLLELSGPAVDFVYANATWGRDGWLLARLDGQDTLAQVRHPERQFRDDVPLGGSGLAASPDASKLVTFRDERTLAFVDASSLSVLGRVELPAHQGDPARPVPSMLVSYTFDAGTRGAWLQDGDTFVVGGAVVTPKGLWPALLGARRSTGQPFLARAWPEWLLDGRRIADVTVSADGAVAYLVVHTTQGQTVTGDVWAWDSSSDATTRLTNLGDVVGITHVGR